MGSGQQQGTSTVSTKPLTQRLPQPANQLISGQYRTSDGIGRLTTISNGEFSFELFDPSAVNQINFVIFSSDVPSSLFAFSSYSASFFGTSAQAEATPFEPVVTLVDQLAGGADMTQATAVTYQQQATIALAAAAISVKAYSAVLKIQNRDLVTTSGGATAQTCHAYIGFTAQSGVIDGWARFSPAANPGNITPIFLRSTQYTAAIQAAGNIFVDGNGEIGRVIGLYEPIANA